MKYQRHLIYPAIDMKDIYIYKKKKKKKKTTYFSTWLYVHNVLSQVFKMNGHSLSQCTRIIHAISSR